MSLLILDPCVSRDLIAHRKRRGIDRYDEVWDGVYRILPPPSNLHRAIVGGIGLALHATVRKTGQVLLGANVSDRADDWTENFRCPDVLAVLAGGRAVDRDTHWYGGPDLVVEIMSPGDDTLEKLQFYESVGVREALVVERDTRTPTLYRLGRSRLSAVRPTALDGEPHLVSTVVPLAFRRVEAKKAGPRLEVRRTAGRKNTWLV